MSKAVAIHATGLVIIFAITLFVAIVVFIKWMDITKTQANQATCTAKLMSFCIDWWKADSSFKTGKPTDWSSRAPQNCEQFNIKEPTAEDCKRIVGK
jgi:hypothetical protein